MPRERLVENVGNQRRLARARHAGDGDEHPERNLDGEVAQVVLARADDAQRLARLARPTRLGERDTQLAAEVARGERIGMPDHLVHGALHHHLAAEPARARPEIDDVIGGANGVLVVLDHDHGVAEIAQAAQRVEQQRVVALVQPDARLVEDVEHADQARADLRREPDALRLAARRACRPSGRG